MDEADRAHEIESALIERGLHSVKKGMHAINANTECEDCGKEIPEARRIAVPYAIRCVICQDIEERPSRVKRF